MEPRHRRASDIDQELALAVGACARRRLIAVELVRRHTRAVLLEPTTR
jgi:hypothetical protein